ALGMEVAEESAETEATEAAEVAPSEDEQAQDGAASGATTNEAPPPPAEQVSELDRPLPDDGLTRTTAADVRTKVTQAENLERSAAALRVEIHKKFSIAFACLVFVLIGAPIAVRFPRGGVGMTIAVSVSVFAVYWMGLIGGETLADRGYVDPFISMWGTNLIFFGVGTWMSLRMSKWVATSRGGGWSDLLFTLKELFRKPAAPLTRS
ncbi:MAG: LptF/LptG family permease, partial [Gemmatimonadota bacterium]